MYIKSYLSTACTLEMIKKTNKYIKSSEGFASLHELKFFKANLVINFQKNRTEIMERYPLFHRFSPILRKKLTGEFGEQKFGEFTG